MATHREAIIKVLAYIDDRSRGVRNASGGAKLTLRNLAKIAGISEFHFHRIFREYLGLSMGQYLKLKALEGAMWRLVRTQENILEIALASGYEDHSAFSRAFAKEIGFSPKEFKKHFEKNRKIALLKLHKNPPSFIGFQTQEERKVFYVQKRGSYFRSSQEAWKELIRDLENNGINPRDQTFYGLPHDDPSQFIEGSYDEAGMGDNLRFDMCVEASSEILKKKASLKSKPGKIPGGKFAVFRHVGPPEKLSDSYHFIYGKWIFENSVTLRDLRPHLLYREPFKSDRTDKNKHSEKVTEIWLPIR